MNTPAGGTPDPLSRNAPAQPVGAPAQPVGAPAQPVRPDPTTPGLQPKPTALGAAVTTAGIGTPAALLTLWLLSLKHITVDPYTATLLGSTGAAVAGYLFRVLQAVLYKWGINPNGGGSAS